MEYTKFEKEYPINVYDTGPNGLLNLYSLFNFMQDIASDHAVKLGFGRDDLMKNNCFWVLSRMYSEIENLPVWGDKIILKTWPNGTDKLFALRNYEVTFADGKNIASGTSSWLILDRTTKKVQRPDPLLHNFHSTRVSDYPSLRYADKLETAGEDCTVNEPFRVKVSDIDVNLHTNNVKYVKWVSDTYDLPFVMKNVPHSVEINYLAESIFDDEIKVKTSVARDNDAYFNHSVIRLSDSKELCRIKLGWKSKL